MNLRYLNIAIECTNLCNMRCSFCTQWDASHPSNKNIQLKGLLSKDDFTKIIGDFKTGSLEVGCINPCWYGESTVNDNFGKFIKTIFYENKTKGFFKRLALNTNGLKFDENISDIFLDYADFIKKNRLDEYMLNLTFSLDACTEATFEKVKGIPGDNFKKILNNIHYLIKKRAELKLLMPNMTYQFVITAQNEHESDKFLQYWQGYLAKFDVDLAVEAEIAYYRDKDQVFFRTEHDSRPEFFAQNIERKNAFSKKHGFSVVLKENGDFQEKSNSKANFQRKPCFQLWNMCVISCSGRVAPCCKDVFFELLLGNIKNMTIEEMWLGKRLEDIRLAQIKGEFDKYKICAECMCPPGGYMSDEDIIDYLKLIGKDELISKYLNKVNTM